MFRSTSTNYVRTLIENEKSKKVVSSSFRTKPTMAKNKLWGRHRRRHIRNETLIIVWNYTATTLKKWWAKTNGDYEAAQAYENQLRLLSAEDWFKKGRVTTTDPSMTTPSEATRSEPIEMKEISQEKDTKVEDVEEGIRIVALD